MSRNKAESLNSHSPKQSGSGVRRFHEDDLPEVVRLMGKLFPRSPEANLQVKEDILTKLLFNNPWEDEDLPSLVYENKSGKITGFLGVAPRPMEINNRPVRAAISYNLMVDPENRSSLAGIGLVKEFLSGPQDLSFADSATDTSRRLWERLGGITIPLYSLYWKHPLRPTSFATHHLKKRAYLNMLSRVATPVCRLTDQIIDRFWDGKKDRNLNEKYITRELTVEQMVHYIRQFAEKKSLVPVYTAETMNWLLDLAAMPKRFGELKKEMVCEKDGRLAGWFVYYESPGGVSEILQIKSIPGKEKQVLTILLQKVREQGAVGVAGRLEPEWFTVLPNTAFCFYMPGRVWMLAHSEDSELIGAFKGGDAFITRMEGDMWLL